MLLQVTLANQKASESKHLDSILIEHLLYNTDAKCVVTRILIRIEKPNFLDVDWNSVLENNSKMDSFESVLISDCSALLKKVTNSGPMLFSDLIPTFDTHVGKCNNYITVKSQL